MNKTIGLFGAFLAALAILVGSATSAAAHDLRFSSVTATFDEAQNTYEIQLLYDVDALLVGAEEGHMTTEDYGRYSQMSFEDMRDKLDLIETKVNSQVFPRFDGQRAHPSIAFPEFAAGRPAPPSRFGEEVQTSRQIILTGDIPEGAETFTWQSKEMGNSALVMQRKGSDQEMRYGLAPDEESKAFSLREDTTPETRVQIAKRYFTIGFVHIIPEGIDHILFVLGLFLLSDRFRPLFWQITAFTVAHSVTLCLAIYDVFELNASLVEAIVALSITYVAVENIFTKEMKWWRPCVVFMFGLLHGLTFAGGLKEIGLPKGEFLLSLFTFNIGVEVGHLGVVAIAFALVGWFRHRDWYRGRIVVPISILIGLVAGYWSITRFWGILFG